jgi:hypothetical protein
MGSGRRGPEGQFVEGGLEEMIEKKHQDRGDQGPGDNGMQSRIPKESHGAKHVLFNQGRNFFHRQGKAGSMEEPLAGAVKGKEQCQLKRGDQVVGDLNGGKVYPEQEGCNGAQQGRHADNGKDAQNNAQGKAEGDLLGGHSLFEQLDDGPNDFSFPKGTQRQFTLLVKSASIDSPGFSL